jgi:ppGpp synthetase/RelA/SpoT-type nucleotidyltranferase
MGIDQASMASEFERRASLYKRLLEESLFVLEKALKTACVKYHSIPSRLKSLDSIVAKAKRKAEGKDIPIDPFLEITDIVGLRVVCLFLSDLGRVGEIIKKQFEVVAEDNKIEGTEVSSFGYMSVHFVAKMKKGYSGPRYEGLADMPFEIQVRTIAMDAWATISHYLDYKSDVDVPSEMRRDFYALSGLFYVADSHFEMFFKERERGQVAITAELKTGKLGLDQEINLDSLKAYLLLRFPDRKHSESKSVSELVSELRHSGYLHLSQLDEAIERSHEAFLAYEKTVPPHGGGKFADVGVARVSLSIADEDFRRNRQDSETYIEYRKMLKDSPESTRRAGRRP